MSDDTPQPRKPSRVWRWLFRAFLLLFLLIGLTAIVGGLAGYLAYDYITRPGVAGTSVQIVIPEGLNGQQVGELLADAGLLEHELFLRAAIRLDDPNKSIKHGPYSLPKGLSPTQLLHLLHEGPNRAPDPNEMQRVTIPEGLTAAQMAELFDQPNEFLEAVRDRSLLSKLGEGVASSEGFLMPNTYFFTEEPGEREVVERMIEQFQTEYAELLKAHPDVSPDDTQRILTIASLVEEEAKVNEERPIVASVIYNRIERTMPLDMDSTLQYALNKYGQRLLDRDKEVDSPYNTYKNAGLPPGPISNPGVASIRAAMDPADTEYLFFVSNADGKTHTFSKTLDEHNRAVAKFREEIAVQRREQREQAQQ